MTRKGRARLGTRDKAIKILDKRIGEEETKIDEITENLSHHEADLKRLQTLLPGQQVVVREDTTKELSKELSLITQAPGRTLYYYTSIPRWNSIQKAQILVAPDGARALNLLDVSNLRAGEETRVRISVRIPEAIQFREFSSEYLKHLKDGGEIMLESIAHLGFDSSRWWFCLNAIPSSQWTEVRVDDIPVGKRSLPHQPESEEPVWKTPMGEARCDFCGFDEATACYRYECPPFIFSDGWHNGGGELSSDSGWGDWAACWYCAALIQNKNIATLLVRGDAQMRDTRVVQGGKHSTESGIYDPTTSHNRVREFFSHYTSKRTFIGKCDFCSIHGESVVWQYECGTFTTTHPMSGISSTSDTPWCVCDECAKLIDRNKTKDLASRALEYQLRRASEDGLAHRITPRSIGRVRLDMTRWVDLFFRHRRREPGSKHPLADLPVRRIIEQASVPAQAALNEQLTLLRWIEGSDGREYIGNWNASYADRQYDGPATDNEISLWTLPLRYGEAYYWDPRVAAYIRQSAHELHENTDVPFVLDKSMLPAPQGFFYSDVAFGKSADQPCRAIGWTIAYDVKAAPPTTAKDRTQIWRTTCDVPRHGGGDLETATSILITFWAQRPQDRVLRPAGQLVWGFGVDYRRVFFANTTNPDDAEQKSFTDMNERPEMIAAMLQFIQQKIVIASHRLGVSSATKKRVEREYPEHEATVRVITLRRKQRLDYEPPSEPTGRVLTVQSQVRGHWRSQCFNTANHQNAEVSVGCKDHQTIYIHPFWRGPSDGPIKKIAGSVFDVSQ